MEAAEEIGGDEVSRTRFAKGDDSDEALAKRRLNPASWKSTMRTMVADHHAAVGSKAVTPSGSISVPVAAAEVTDVDVPPRDLLSQIPALGLEGTDQFSYGRQSVHTSNAASRADYTSKPVADYQYVLVEDRARVVAELAPPIPERLLQDVPGFADSVTSSLLADVTAAIEGLVISGDVDNAAPKDDFNGILNTSGVLAQAFATDVLSTIRKSTPSCRSPASPARSPWCCTPPTSRASNSPRTATST